MQPGPIETTPNGCNEVVDMLTIKVRCQAIMVLSQTLHKETFKTFVK